MVSGRKAAASTDLNQDLDHTLDDSLNLVRLGFTGSPLAGFVVMRFLDATLG